jgi:putative membrane protein
MDDKLTPDQAPRRTRLAGERTRLAWWRTALAAFAVGIGVGRGIPALDPTVTPWPYIALGVAFVLYGLLLMQFGNRRGIDVDRAVVAGDYAAAGRLTTGLLGWLGIALGVGAVLVVLFAG